MPHDRKRYPADWSSVAQACKDRAGWRCEDCGLRHGAVGYRRDDAGGKFVPCRTKAARASAIAAGRRLFTVVLTCAHVGAPRPDGSPGDKRDKMDCRPENLRALCQRCHLRFDRDEHAEARLLRRVDRARWKIGLDARVAPFLPGMTDVVLDMATAAAARPAGRGAS